MKVKIQERREAIELRKNGETIPNIALRVGVSKSSVSLWLRGVALPKKARVLMLARRDGNRSLAHEKRREITRTKLRKAAAQARVLVSRKHVDSEIALVLCSLMYWCEGTKSRNDSEFTFTNADPLTIRGFLALLRSAVSLDESRFRIKMHLHGYHDENVQRKFWSEVTSIPETQFQNTFWKAHAGKHVKKDYPGCIHLRYHDVTLSRKVCATARAFLGSMLK